MSQLVDELERFSLSSTQGEWYPCTWDAMERPHISLVDGPHHNSTDIAQNLTAGNAIYIAELKNAAPKLFKVVNAAEQITAAFQPPLYPPNWMFAQLALAVEALYEE